MYGLNVVPPLGIGFRCLPKPHCLGQGWKKHKIKNFGSRQTFKHPCGH